MPQIFHPSFVTVTEKVQMSLNSVRPFLQKDGGDIELVRVRDDGFVEVRLIGACLLCPMAMLTLRAGVERKVLRDVPEVVRLERVH